MAMCVVSSAYAARIDVVTHINYQGNASATLRVVDQIGAEWIRDEYNWDLLETVKGSPNSENVSGKLLPETAAANGKKLALILCYGNALYTGGGEKALPLASNSEYFNGWKNYVRYVATTWGEQIDAYEVWNEPDIFDFNTNYSKGGGVYNVLLRETYNIIKECDPTAIVIGGSLTKNGTTYLGQMLNAGAASYMDALSVHVYTHSSGMPEGNGTKSFRKYLDGLEAVMDQYSYTGDVWLNEYGCYTGTAEDSHSEEEQAAYAIRAAVLWEDYLKDNGRNGKLMWYELADKGIDQSKAEQNYGLVSQSLVPKKSYYSVKTYNKLLADQNFDSLNESGTQYKAKYTNSATGDATYIVWSSGSSSENITVNLSGDNYYVYDYQGKLLENGNVTASTKVISVTGNPKFVVCEKNITMIEGISYDVDKNVLAVSGISRANNVTIQICKNVAVISEFAKNVADGKFSCEFSPEVFGNLTVNVVPDVGDGDTGDITVAPTVVPTVSEKTRISAMTVDYDDVTGSAVISGTTTAALDNEDLTVLVVKKNSDLNNLTADEIVNIGQVKINGTQFTYRFEVPESAAEVYKVVLVGGSFTDNATIISETQYVEIKNKEYNSDKNVISLSGTSLSPELTIQLMQNGQVKSQAVKTVNGNTFSYELSPSVFGAVTIVVRPSGGAAEEVTLNVIPTVLPESKEYANFSEFSVSYENNDTATINFETDKVLSNKNLTVLVVRKNTALSGLSEAEIVNVGQIQANGSEFSYSFEIPNKETGEYAVYAGGDFTNGKAGKTLSPYAQIGEFTVTTTQDGSINVSISANNDNNITKHFTVFTAQYDALGRLVSINKEDETLNADSSVDRNYTYIVGENVTRIRGFVWDMPTMLPLYEAQ
jgi:hypothetical protein